jgi:hypothetical protein
MQMIIKADVATILENSQRDLAELVRQRDQLNVKIIQLQNQVRALAAVVWRNQLSPSQRLMHQALVGLSEGVRSVLRLQGKAMTAGEVKDALDLMGYDFKGLGNPSALVHNTLKRMAGTGELAFTPGAKTYQFPFVSHLGFTRLK